MNPLLDQPPPRSDETVTRLTSALIANIRSSTRRAAWSLCPPVVVLGVLFAILCAGTGDYTVQAVLGLGYMATTALSIPVVLIIGSMSNRAATVIKLVRHAPAYPASASGPAIGNANRRTVTWQEGAAEAVADLEVPWKLRGFAGTVTVLAVPHQTSVGILLDEDLYLSARNTWDVRRQSDQPVASSDRQA